MHLLFLPPFPFLYEWAEQTLRKAAECHAQRVGSSVWLCNLSCHWPEALVSRNAEALGQVLRDLSVHPFLTLLESSLQILLCLRPCQPNPMAFSFCRSLPSKKGSGALPSPVSPQTMEVSCGTWGSGPETRPCSFGSHQSLDSGEHPGCGPAQLFSETARAGVLLL